MLHEEEEEEEEMNALTMTKFVSLSRPSIK